MGRKAVLATLLASGLVGCMPALGQQRPGAVGATQRADFAAAVSAYRQADYPAALKIVQPMAAEGDAAARVMLGRMYEYGTGIPQDEVKAANLFAQAALAHYAGGESELSAWYFHGPVVSLRNPVIGYALSMVVLSYELDEGGRASRRGNLDLERSAMTPGQIMQARVLAHEVQQVGLLAALRDYLGDGAANQLLCQVPAGPNICKGVIRPGAAPYALAIDAQGAVHAYDKEVSAAELKARLMVMARISPQSVIIVTVEGQGLPVDEAIQWVFDQAAQAGIALLSVVPRNPQDHVPQAGYHHLSFIFAELVPGHEQADIAVTPSNVAPRFRQDRQPVLVWLDEKGKVTAARLDKRYPVIKPDKDAVRRAAQFDYEPCLRGDVGSPCVMEVWVPSTAPLKQDMTPGVKHELAIVNPSVLTQTRVSYPRHAIGASHQGSVLLLVHVSAEGAPMDISYAQMSGSPELDNAARNAVMKWTFTPGSVEGVVADSYIEIPVNFTLTVPQVE
jgi:TonB family protein